jgi:hypothetical protein
VKNRNKISIGKKRDGVSAVSFLLLRNDTRADKGVKLLHTYIQGIASALPRNDTEAGKEKGNIPSSVTT